jgi:hypothetical protein
MLAVFDVRSELAAGLTAETTAMLIAMSSSVAASAGLGVVPLVQSLHAAYVTSNSP